MIFRAEGTWTSAFKEIEGNGLMTPEIEHLIRFLKGVERGKQGRSREALRRDLV